MRRPALFMLASLVLISILALGAQAQAEGAPRGTCGVRDVNMWWDNGLWVHIETNTPINTFCVDGRCISVAGKEKNSLTFPLGKKNAYSVTIMCAGGVSDLNVSYFPVDMDVQREGSFLVIEANTYARCKSSSLCYGNICDENAPFFLRVPALPNITLRFVCDGRVSEKKIETNAVPRGAKRNPYGFIKLLRRVGRAFVRGKVRIETEGNVFSLVPTIPTPPQVKDVFYVEGEGNTLSIRIEMPGKFTVWKYTGEWNYLGTYVGVFEINIADNSPFDLDPTPGKISDPIGVGTGGLVVSADLNASVVDPGEGVLVYGHVEKNGTPLGNYWVNIFLDGNRLGGPLYMVGPSDWWNASWAYRREINISNPDGVDINGVAVRIEMNLLQLYNEGKLRRDAGDLRFVTKDGNVLSYWIQSVPTDINAVPQASDDNDVTTPDADCEMNPTYTYIEVNDTDGSALGEAPTGWYELDFDDTNWLKGSAPFGNTGGECTTVLTTPPQDLFLRKWFYIPGEIISGELNIAVGGGVRCYVNEVLVLDDLNADNNATYWNYTIELNGDVLKEGDNLLACWVAEGGENNGTYPAYFDAVLEVNYYERILPDANVWVRMDLPAEGASIYVYYGNPQATPAESYDDTFDTYALSKDCSVTSRGGSCSTTFDPSTDLGGNYIFFEDQRYGYGVIDMTMSGDFADNDSGPEYADIYYQPDALSQTHIGSYYTGQDACPDTTAIPYPGSGSPPWPMDAKTWIEGQPSLTMLADTTRDVDYIPSSCSAYAHFTWKLNAKVRRVLSADPTVTFGPEMMNTSTDAFGDYSWAFSAPETPGEHVVRVEVNDGADFAAVDVPLFVRKNLRIMWADVLPRTKDEYSVYIVSADPTITEVNLILADANNVNLQTYTCAQSGNAWLCDVNANELNFGDYILKAEGYAGGTLTGFDAKYTEVDSSKVYEFATYRDVNTWDSVIIEPDSIRLQGILAGFAYRRPITLDNSAGPDYNALPIKIVVDTQTLISAGKMKSDCSDVRFTDSDGVTELPYWLERGCGTTQTVFWVKVPDIPGGGEKTIYMYYGNLRAPSASDGSKVFDFFDDFETWRGWTQYGSGVVQQSNLVAWDGQFSLLKTSNNDPNGGYKDLGFVLNYPFVLEAEIYRVNFSGGNCDRIGVIDDSGNGYGPGYCHNSSLGLFIDIRSGYSGTVSGSNDTGPDLQYQWYKMRMIWEGNGTIIAEYYDANGVLQASTTITDTSYSSFTRVYVFGGHDYAVDDIRIYPYIQNPPAPTVGAEESVPIITYAASGSWLGGFSYRDEVIIDNTEGGPLTDFQVKVVVDTNALISEGKLKSDCSDVRFTDSDGVTELPYWLERGCGTTQTVFWVKVPDIPGGGEKTIYMYYGNPSATSESNGFAVFEFFDDFEEWSGWTQYGSGVVQQYCTDAFHGSCSLLKTANNDPNGGYKDLGFVLNYPFVLEAFVKRINYNGGSWDRIGVIDDSGNGYGSAYRHNRDSVGIDVRTGYSASATYDATASTDPEYRWYIQRLVWKGDGTIIAQAEEVNGEGIGGIMATDTNYTSFTRAYVFGGNEYLVDDMRIRKYADPMPKVTVRSYEPRYAPHGYAEFNLVVPNRVDVWTYLDVNIDDVRDTNVTATLFSYDGSVLCSFEVFPDIYRYDVSGCLEGNASVRLRLDLSTNDGKLTPVVRYAHIHWIEEKNIRLYEPYDVYQFRNQLMHVRGWLQTPVACSDVNAYLYFRTEGVPHAIEEYNYDHFITRTYDANVSIGDDLRPLYNHPDLGYYYMEVNIDNPAGVDLSNYPVKVVVDTATLIAEGKMREDCGDIRVADAGYNELNYWIVPGTCNTAATEIWVRIPTIPAAGTKIYVYHGRPDYTSLSDPASVFPDENTLTAECSGRVSGGVCSVTMSLPAGWVAAPWQPTGYGELNILMSGDFDYGGAIGDPNSCDPGSTYERSAFYLNGSCIGTYSTGEQDCIDRAPPNTPIDVRALVTGKGEFNVDADASSQVNYDPGCGYYYHYVYTLKLKVRKYVSPEPSVTVGPDVVDVARTSVYVSDALDTGLDSPTWGTISWGGEAPANTRIRVYVRTSPDGSSWSEWYEVDNGERIPAPSARYIEYNVVFETLPDAKDIPVFDDLRINYYSGVAVFTLVGPTTQLRTSDPNPYTCGSLPAGGICEPEWNTVPTERGKYELLMEVLSDCGFEGNSNTKIVYVFAPTTIQNFSADKNVVAKGDTLTLTGQLVDELGDPVIHRTVFLYDGNTFLGTAETDDTGWFTFTFTVPLTAPIGYHTLRAVFPTDPVTYYWRSEASTTVKYSSRPVVSDITVVPSPAGIGDSVRISAKVTDEVGVDSVDINVVRPDGASSSYPMACTDTLCTLDYNDTWIAGTYTFTITATNLDGITGENNGSFIVEGYATYAVQVEKNAYGALEDVLLVDSPYWANPMSTYSILLDTNGVSGESVALEANIDRTYDPFDLPSHFVFYRSDGEGNAYTFVSGVDGNAVDVDGWIVVPSRYLDPPTVSILAWVRIEGSTGKRYIFSLSDSTGADILSLYSPAGDTNVCFTIRAGTETKSACTSSLPTGVWTHVAATFDGLTLRVFVNGDVNAYASLASKADLNYAGALPYSLIGADFNGTAITDDWDGAIDDLRIYSGMLLGSEIQKAMNGELLRRVALAHWKFDGDLSDASPWKERPLTVSSSGDTWEVIDFIADVGEETNASFTGTIDANGVEGNAGYFSGTDVLTLAGNDLGGAVHTFAAWVRPDANGGILAEQGGAPGWAVTLTSGGRIVCTYRDAGGTEHNATSASTVSGWTHIACVFGIASTRVYINGTEENRIVYTPASADVTGDVNVGVGFVGSLDDVRMYRSALSSSDVSRLAAKKDVPWGLAARITFDGNVADSAEDWLVRIFSGGWPTASYELTLTPTTIPGMPVRVEKRAAICNTGETNVSGYLYVDVQTGAGSTWSTVPPIVVNDVSTGTRRTIAPGACLSVASIYNASPWNTDSHPSGLYRARMVLLAEGGSPSDTSTYITLSDGRKIWDTSEFNIVSATLALSDINHTHLAEYNLNEYETTDTIDWIDVYVTARDSTALDVNVTLSLVDQYLVYAGFGPNNETKYYGTIYKDTTAVQRWDNGGSGYYVPEGVASGTYQFRWLVEMNTANGPSVQDYTRYVIIHNLPSEFNSSAPTRIYYYDDANGWGIYTFCMTNLWSKDINDINVYINCPSGVGLICVGTTSGTGVESLASLAPGASACFDFNIIATPSSVSGDYNVDVNVEYLNPAGNRKFWPNQQRHVIEIRKAGILEIILSSYPTDVVRGEDNAVFISKAHNTGTVTDENAWIAYTYPSDWNVLEANTDGTLVGDVNAFKASLPPDANIDLNVVFGIPETAALGPQLVRIETGTATDPTWGDFKNVYVTVWDRPVLTLEANDYNVSVGEKVAITAKLTYSDGNAIPDQRIDLNKDLTPLAGGYTDANGVWTYVWDTSTESPGTYTLKAIYEGNADIYTLPAEANIVINIGLPPDVNAWLSDYNVGYGVDVNIEANAADDQGITRVWAVVVEPDGSSYEVNLTNDTGIHYYATIRPWKEGEYNITVYAEDLYGSIAASDVLHLYAVAWAQMGVQTDKNFYLQGEGVNLVSPGWWDVNWAYRRLITIVNNSSTALTNYQVRVPVDTNAILLSGHARWDLGDFRFVEGGTELNFWWNEEAVVEDIIPQASDDADPTTADATCASNPVFRYYYCTDPCLPTGWYEESFDDSLWSEGNAPFGATGGECTTALSSAPDDLFVRKWVTIPGIPLEANLYVASDDGARCYINGQLVLDDIASSHTATYWNYEVNVESVLRPGKNLVACWVANGGENPGTGTGYLDIRLRVKYIRTASTDMNFWVVVPYIPAGGEVNVYLYYGNPDATRANDANTVFSFVPEMNAQCEGNTAGGTCTGTLPPAGYAFAPYQNNLLMTFWLSGDFGGNETDENAYLYYSLDGGPFVFVGRYYRASGDGCPDEIAAPVDPGIPTWPDDWSHIIKGHARIEFNTVAGQDVDYIPSTCSSYYHYTWELNNVYLRKYVSPEPDANVGPKETLAGSYILPGRTFYGYIVATIERNEAGTWTHVATDVNDLNTGTERLFDSLFDLSTIWAEWNTYGQPQGTYRVLVRLYDPYGNPLTYNGQPIEEWNTFRIGPPPVDVNIADVRIYEVNGVADPRTEGSLVDSGLRKTIYLPADRQYRVEIHVSVLNGEWNIADSNVWHADLNADWNVYDIWYVVPTATELNGGTFDGNVEWNTMNDGAVDEGLTAVFAYLVDLNTSVEEEHNTAIHITHPAFIERNDWVAIATYVPDTTPPYAVEYNLVNTVTGQTGWEINVIRTFEGARIYAEWNEVIGDAYVEFNSTSSALTTDTITPDGNYTEYNFTITSFWLLGPHVAKIYASDLSGNWNNDLNYLTFYVWGIADVMSIDLNDYNVYVGESVEINCTVVDRTDGNAPIPNYPVKFYDNGTFIGNVITDANGVASLSYTFTTFGDHIIECNTETNSTLWYMAIPPENEKNVYIFVRESVPPEWNEVNYTPKVHRNEALETNVHWTDNHLVDTVRLLVGAFKYRRPVSVSNATGSTLTDFQVKIVVDTNALISGGKLKSDCSDVRFTDSDGTTYIPYWIEPNTCGTTQTVFWVRVPSVPAGGKTIYMYYGNPSATSESNGFAVFDFFDDFEEWSGWNTAGSGVVSQDCTFSFDGNCSLIKTTNNDPNGGYKSIGAEIDYPFVFEAYVYRTDYAGGSQDRLGVLNLDGNGYGVYMNHGGNETGVDVRFNWGSTTYQYGASVSSDPEYRWYLARLVWNNGSVTGAVYEIDGTLLGSYTITDSNTTSFNYVYVFGGYTYYADDVRIRKYASPEPTTTVGSEESGILERNAATYDVNDVWAYLTWTVPYNEPLGLHFWIQEANDPSGNMAETNTFEFNVWGWAHVANAVLSPTGLNPDENVEMNCLIADRDLNTPLPNYEVNFYVDGNYVGTVYTDASGWARFEYNVDSLLGLHTMTCTIGSDVNRLYDPYPGEENASAVFNVTTGTDTDPPDAVEWNIVDMNTGAEGKEINVYRGDDLNFWAIWDENISSAWAEFSPDGVTDANVPAYVDGNYTEAYIDTNTEWTRGLHTIIMKAMDEANNPSMDANSAEVNVYVWVYANVEWVSPTGVVNQNNDMNAVCRVYEQDSNDGIENYTVAFYSDLGGGTFLGTADTNVDGYATLYVDLNGYYGYHTFWCEITSDPARYYEANVSYDSETLYIAAFNLKALSMELNNTDVNEGDVVEANFTVYNEKDDVNAWIEINVMKWDGSSWITVDSNVYYGVFAAGQNISFLYTWAAYPGRYRFVGVADYNDVVDEDNEADNVAWAEINVPTWTIIHGEVNLEPVLGATAYYYYKWSGTGESVLVHDSDYDVNIERIEGMKDVNDVNRADYVLGTNGNPDCILCTFAPSGDLNYYLFSVGGKDVNAPYIDVYGFPTGIAYEDVDGDGNFDPTEPIVFITEVYEGGVACPWGTCEYVIKVPSPLKDQNTATSSLVTIMAVGG